MKKKFLSVMIAVIMCGTVAVAPAYATEAVPEVGPTNGDIITEQKSIDQQLSEYLARSDKSAKEKQAATAKAALAKSLANGMGTLFRSARVTANNLNMTFCSQKNGYYCGPATIQQTLKYLNGSSPSQDNLATALGTTSQDGTDTNVMCSYLNDNTSKSYAVLWWWADANALSEMVISDIDSGTPIVAHVKITTKGEWPYTTTGHYMNYSGYSSGGSRINVTDPWANRYGEPTGKYSVSNTAAEIVTDRIIW